jgi:hypothetical protein
MWERRDDGRATDVYLHEGKLKGRVGKDEIEQLIEWGK